MNATYATLIALALVAAAVALAPLFRAWRGSRGRRLIVCPENHVHAVVELDAVDAAFHSFLGTRELHLKSCSRWPEKAGCGQKCLEQVESSPNGCLVRAFVADWYREQSCAICRKPFGEFQSWDHRPALMSPERVTMEWAEVPAEELPGKTATHQPVCWDCHVVESLYRLHPELVTERPPHRAHYL